MTFYIVLDPESVVNKYIVIALPQDHNLSLLAKKYRGSNVVIPSWNVLDQEPILLSGIRTV